MLDTAIVQQFCRLLSELQHGRWVPGHSLGVWKGT